MSFNYFSSIPNPPNDPADDVFLMQTNSSSIFNALEVDHGPFNDENCGQHNQVNFIKNQTAPPILNKGNIYANNPNPDAQSWPFWQNATGSYQIVGPTTASASGSVTLPGGIIMKWGSITGMSKGANPYSFPVAFPTIAYSVILQAERVATGNIDALYVLTATLNQTGFTVTNTSTSIPNAYYIAIGK